MPMAHVYPAFFVIAAIMLIGWVIARRSSFYTRLITPRTNSRYESLDGLRGFLAVAVIIHHGLATYTRVTTGKWTVGDSPTYGLFGTAAVAMFFMITGFLFWGKMLKDGENFDVRHHVRGRITRLVPMYLFVATLALIITLINLWPLQTSVSRLSWLFFSIYGLGLPRWSPIHGFDPGKIVAGVTWTLRYEWLFYGILPLLVGFRKTRWIVAMAVGYLVYFAFTNRGWIHKPLGPSVNLLGGMIAAQIQHTGSLTKINWKSRWVSFLGLAILAMLPKAISVFPIAVFPMTLVFFITVVKGNNYFGVLTASGPKVLGTISYSVYLLHGMVLYLAHPMLHRVAMTQSAAFYWVALTGLAVLTVLISAVTYRWIEEPFIETERARRKAGVPASKLTPIYTWPTQPTIGGQMVA